MPPSDPEVRKVIDKLADFVAKNGRSFEDVTRQRNPDNGPFRHDAVLPAVHHTSVWCRSTATQSSRHSRRHHRFWVCAGFCTTNSPQSTGIMKHSSIEQKQEGKVQLARSRLQRPTQVAPLFSSPINLAVCLDCGQLCLRQSWPDLSQHSRSHNTTRHYFSLPSPLARELILAMCAAPRASRAEQKAPPAAPPAAVAEALERIKRADAGRSVLSKPPPLLALAYRASAAHTHDATQAHACSAYPSWQCPLVVCMTYRRLSCWPRHEVEESLAGCDKGHD